MNLERRLRDNLDATAGQLPEPPDSFAEVSRRGRRRRAVERAVIAVVAVIAIAAVPIGWSVVDERTVDFDPVAPPTATATPEATPSPAEDPAASPSPDPSPGSDEDATPETIAVGDLRAPVLAYGPYEHGQLELIDRDDALLVWSGFVESALPDGRDGVVLQQEQPGALQWLPDAEERSFVTLAEVDGELVLRGLMPDGRVLYSVRPEEPVAEPEQPVRDDDEERFFAVELDDGAEPELLASVGAFERWTVGPAVAADGQLVHASCHLRCSLWPGLAEAPEGTEALYHGGGGDAGTTAAIEGLTATPDGRVLAFVEHDPTWPEGYEDRPPELVLLAGTSFDQLGRVPLPWADGELIGAPTVSLSADGQRVLVGLGASGPPPVTQVPTTSYLVEDALGEVPEVRPVDFAGALRWADPVEAAGPGGPVTAEERDVAERLIAFAEEPGPDRFADLPLADEVLVGLGPELIGGGPRQAAELADPAGWRLEPEDDLYDGYVGPLSVIDTLADSGEVRIAGGPHSHCAGTPKPPPDEEAGLRQISIQPRDFESCIEWFTVDAFLDESGEIAAVTMDLWGP